MKTFDVVIVGGGPIGIFGAFQAGLLGMKVAVVETLDRLGGQCAMLYPEKPIYDIPGCPKVQASDLIKNLINQANAFNPEYFLSQVVESVSFSDDMFALLTSDGSVISAKAVIIAAGAGAFAPNKPPLDNIDAYENISVFYSVTDVESFKRKKLAIAGGGDSAVDWAINLAEISDHIYLIHRRDKFRAAPSSLQKIEALVKQGLISLVTPYQLSKINGENGVMKSIEVESIAGDKMNLEVDALLSFFGLRMSLGPILNWGLNIHNHHIEVDPLYHQTNIPGVYAVGDIATYEGKLKLILSGFAEVASALHHSYPRVFNGKTLHFQYSTNKTIC